jgi:hypothetical protein
MVESDVGRARSRMNLSHWDEYSSDRRQALLMEIAVAVRGREMPPARYTAIHPDARLTDQERVLISGWASAEMRRTNWGQYTQSLFCNESAIECTVPNP